MAEGLVAPGRRERSRIHIPQGQAQGRDVAFHDVGGGDVAGFDLLDGVIPRPALFLHVHHGPAQVQAPGFQAIGHVLDELLGRHDMGRFSHAVSLGF